MKTLLCLCGLPKSGKTTFARKFAADHGVPIVQPDAIRLALHGQRFAPMAEPHVWAIAHTMVRSLFLAGSDLVILDATNSTRKRRDEWQSKEWQTVFHVLDATRDVCLHRAGGDLEIIPVIYRMADQWQPLGDGETAWLPLGATGVFSQGACDKDDEGAVRIAIAADPKAHVVRIEFGKEIAWLGLHPEQAFALANSIALKARSLIRKEQA